MIKVCKTGFVLFPIAKLELCREKMITTIFLICIEIDKIYRKV
jgi:hypothetical protein